MAYVKSSLIIISYLISCMELAEIPFIWNYCSYIGHHYVSAETYFFKSAIPDQFNLLFS